MPPPPLRIPLPLSLHYYSPSTTPPPPSLAPSNTNTNVEVFFFANTMAASYLLVLSLSTWVWVSVGHDTHHNTKHQHHRCSYLSGFFSGVPAQDTAQTSCRSPRPQPVSLTQAAQNMPSALRLRPSKVTGNPSSKSKTPVLLPRGLFPAFLDEGSENNMPGFVMTVRAVARGLGIATPRGHPSPLCQSLHPTAQKPP